ncbi:MAG: hypothetical protein IT385_07420 [Deltaproteobacteria bacterium]|nr:hypothetical protein [Deltaproteobacteria bacterium]
MIVPAIALALVTGGADPDARAADPKPGPAPEPLANALTLEPLAVVFAKTIALEYERRLSSGVSLALGPVVTLGETTTGGDEPVEGTYVAWGLNLAVRFYPWSVAPAGAFVGPFAGVAWTSAEAGDSLAEGVGWSVGGLAGYTWILGRYFVFSVGAGAAWSDMDLDVDGERRGKQGVYPSLRLAIGGVF